MAEQKDYFEEFNKLADHIRQGGINKDHEKRRAAEKKERKYAEKEQEGIGAKKGSKPTFLRPDDLSGDYDFKRALMTTLGMKADSKPRLITAEDLEAFRKNIDALAKNYSGGITPEQVISLSLHDDIERANKQIYSAAPYRRKSGLVEFLTNASEQSKDNVHYVRVEYLGFSKVVFDTKKTSTFSVKNLVANGKVKFECDCRRYKYWLRYLNSIAGTTLGRIEPGFPKLRNPQLQGVACKHILRVMQWSRSAAGVAYLEQEIKLDRQKQHGTVSRVKKDDITQMLAEQIVGQNKKRNQIQPKVQKAIKELQQRAENHARKEQRKMEATTSSRSANAARNKRLEAALKAGLITQEDFNFLSNKGG
ncbi:hypothetical protein [Acinetobacter colistiniresistens]|uniref:hypothetical protein n=1 Tax=Acinetobacter colistiniresistens TaxID=280145 RepID=UPI0012502831|nr:hypothetical protein [Acinetobacter colistiniresistens]